MQKQLPNVAPALGSTHHHTTKAPVSKRFSVTKIYRRSRLPHISPSPASEDSSMEENRSTDLTLAAHVCASYRDAFPKVAFDPQWLRIPYRSLPTLRCPFAGITVAETQCRIFTGFRYVLSLSILFFLSTLYPLLSGFTMEAMIFASFGFAMTGIHDFTYTSKRTITYTASAL